MKNGQDRNGSKNHLAFKRDKDGFGLHNITAPTGSHLHSTIPTVRNDVSFQGPFLPINAADDNQIVRNDQRPDIDLERGFKVILTLTT